MSVKELHEPSELSLGRFLRNVIPMSIIAVIAWALFAGLYSAFFPVEVQPAQPLGVWWLWLLGGTGGFVLTYFVLLRLFKTPPQWRTHAAIALTAPALVCDMLTGTQPELWLPASAGVAADRLYLSLIVGGVGLIQLLSLFHARPKAPSGAQ